MLTKMTIKHLPSAQYTYVERHKWVQATQDQNLWLPVTQDYYKHYVQWYLVYKAAIITYEKKQLAITKLYKTLSII